MPMYQSHNYNSVDVILIARNWSPKKFDSFLDQTKQMKITKANDVGK